MAERTYEKGTSELVVEAILRVAGVGIVFQSMLAGQIASGRLIRVVEERCPSSQGFYLY